MSRSLSYGDSLLLEADIRLLNEHEWLNDKVIDFVFEYITNTRLTNGVSNADTILCCTGVVQLMKLNIGDELKMIVEDLRLPDRKYIICPINDNDDSQSAGGSHWSLLVYDAELKEFTHFDSMHQANYCSAKHVAASLRSILSLKGELALNMGNSPAQQNCYDCGMYILQMTEVLLDNILSNETSINDADLNRISPEDIKQSRTDWRKVIQSLQKTSSTT